MNNLGNFVVCATSLRSQGNMDFRFGGKKEVLDNRTYFLQEHGIAYQEHIAMQCDHKDVISIVDHKHPALGATSQSEQIYSEVLVTQKKHLALMLLTADCQPTSFYDSVTGTIALAHISRTTLLDGLSQKTISFLQKECGVDPKNLKVSIGPSIHKESYAFSLPLTQTHTSLSSYTEERDGVAHIDLIGAHIAKLTEAGVPRVAITVSGDDTGKGQTYFSHYQCAQQGVGDDGRMATILMMR